MMGQTATDCARFPLRGFPIMRRWMTRSVWAAALGLALPAAASAQLPRPLATPPATEATAEPVPVTPAPAPAAAPAPAVAAAVVIDPYRSATPYNATVVGRAAPNAQYNRVNF